MRKASFPHRGRTDQDARFNAAFAAARRVRGQIEGAAAHRAFARLKLTPATLAQAIVLPLLLSGMLWRYRADLDIVWHACMTFWALHLELPLALLPPLADSGAASGGAPAAAHAAASVLPPALLLAAGVLGYVLSYRLREAAYPLRFPVRIACVILIVSVLVAWWRPSLFPGDSAEHGQQILTMGRALLFAAPVLLGMGYFLLPESLPRKLAHTALMLLFLALLIPHQVVLHLLLLHNVSPLLMPLLYFGFGAIFDALVFIALYAWAVSNVSLRP